MTVKQSDQTAGVRSRMRTYSEKLHVEVEVKSHRRKNSDVVDSIGDQFYKVEDALGGGQRPTTLDTKPMIDSEQTQKQDEWSSTARSSKEETDATPCTPPDSTYTINTDSSFTEMEIEMPVGWNASEYNMRHRRRGHAVIFNHDVFETKHYAPREGSKIDVNNLCEKLCSLQFDVTVHDNLEYSEIRDTISKLAAADHSDADCVAVIVMTHGENGLLAPRDSSILYKVDLLWQPFTADKCPTLAGKPKLFFIQACRGNELDAGVKVRDRRTEHDSSSSFKIPTHADFLIAYSSVQGFYSFRNKDTGSWFIQSLCEELNASDNLLQILTRTTRRVTQMESESDKIQYDRQKQVPSITSMLTRDLYFRRKV